MLTDEDEKILAQIYAQIERDLEEARPILDAMIANAQQDLDALLAQFEADTSLADLLAAMDE